MYAAHAQIESRRFPRLDLASSNNEDFTLPHIFQVDSAGVQVIFRSPPGVQVLFFWLGAQPNWHASSTWISPGLQVESTCQIAVWILPGLNPGSIHQESRCLSDSEFILLYF